MWNSVREPAMARECGTGHGHQLRAGAQRRQAVVGPGVLILATSRASRVVAADAGAAPDEGGRGDQGGRGEQGQQGESGWYARRSFGRG